jgi:hypothetical protein
VTQKLDEKKKKLQLRRDRLAFYRHKTVVFSEIMRVRHRHRPRLIVPGFSYVTSTPYRDESPVHLASPQLSSLRSCILASCYLLGASHGLLFPCHHLWRLRVLEAFPEENVFRGCLVELYNAALDLWKVERRLPLQSEASSPV